MKKIVIVVLGLIIIGGVWFVSRKDNNSNLSVSPTPTTFQELATKYTYEDVAVHATSDDCWFVINKKVYDITDYIHNHPGGSSILDGCGKDATELFSTRPMGSGTDHSPRAKSLLDNYYIGNLKE